MLKETFLKEKQSLLLTIVERAQKKKIKIESMTRSQILEALRNKK